MHRLLLAMTVTALIVSGCRTEGLAFRQDQRVEILLPEQNSTVTIPFALEWTVEDFEITGPDGSDRDDAGYFGILMDRTPMPPGEGLAYVARDDESCLRTPGCPDEAYLEDRDIHLTTDTRFEVDALRDTRPVDRPSAPDNHEITVILLDGQSQRIGEAAFTVEFRVDRGQG